MAVRQDIWMKSSPSLFVFVAVYGASPPCSRCCLEVLLLIVDAAMADCA
jgi:hypothetical protein